MVGVVLCGVIVKQVLDVLLVGIGLGYIVVDGNVIVIDLVFVCNVLKLVVLMLCEVGVVLVLILGMVKVIVVYEVIDQKKLLLVIKDLVVYDEMDSYGDEILVESLMVVLGLSVVEDVGELCYVMVCGVQVNFNYIIIDGIVIVSVGGSGFGECMNNLQLIFSDIGICIDIYKSFSVEQVLDVIGGVIDIISCSVFDWLGKYVFVDVVGIYFIVEINVEWSVGGNYEILGYFGKSVKMVFFNQFGVDQEFGIVVVVCYEQCLCNSVKCWVELNYYYNDVGKYFIDGIMGLDEVKGWNGLCVFGNFSIGIYINFIINFGGFVKFEWKFLDDLFYVLLLLYLYWFYENLMMNKMDLYGNVRFLICNQIEDSGIIQINSIYIKNCYDCWDCSNCGVIVSFNWDIGDCLCLILCGGYIEEIFYNNQVYWGVCVYLSNLFVDYENDSYGFLNVVVVFDFSLLISFVFKFNLVQVYVFLCDVKESIDNLCVDFSYNIDVDVCGFGLVIGVEYCYLKIWQDIDFDYFKSSVMFNDYLYLGLMLLGSVLGFLLIDNCKWNEELLLKLGNNNVVYLNVNFISDYKYVEDIVNVYVFVYYVWDWLLLIGGLCYDYICFDVYSLFSDDGGIMYIFVFCNMSGGYNNLLFLLNVMFKLSEDQCLCFFVSCMLGWLMLSNIVQVISISCGDDEEGRGFCIIKQGNVNLQLCCFINIDLVWDLYFNGNNGLILVVLFDKVIKDDIYILIMFENVGDICYWVIQLMNIDEFMLCGIEFVVVNCNLQWGCQCFDMYFNVMCLEGQIYYCISDGIVCCLDCLLYQLDWLFNGLVIWCMLWRSVQLCLFGIYCSWMLVDFGDIEWLDLYYDLYMMFNMVFSYKVGKYVMLKYEVKNLFNIQLIYSIGLNGCF